MNIITGSPSRYYRAGEEVPEELLPDTMRKYAVAAGEEKHEPAPPTATAKPRAPRWGAKGKPRIFHQLLGKSGAERAKKRGPSELHSASWGLATNSLSWRWFRLGATG